MSIEIKVVETEEEELSTVCEQGMFGELGIADPTEQEVQK